MPVTKLTASPRARQLIAPLLVPSEAPFKDYLRAADYCTAVMNYTESHEDREYLAQWRAAFTALMVSPQDEQIELLKQLRQVFQVERSPMGTLRSVKRRTK
ncbi:hypothetical protein ThidrDRAFT_0173 [Thiorhodococcus drewsii AZ1]|uniref:Uncharacterized protein n=1 Tax=Thiorhodococcus drewsii AZ1 TaxID=765913 RepID=G2DVK3_9GAMM|nr:hypothetical protein [Thiorhodococcus drewsii]EGV34018.1 hypothetical protein ThidrDRAFT_0173 [Thiorhodococcus drewsii AZ1]